MYSSHGIFMSWREFIQLEVEDRGNYSRADVDNWARKYKLTPDTMVIWACHDKATANRYNLPADEWDTAQEILEEQMEVVTVTGAIIKESDDGDGGYLIIKRSAS